MFQNAGTHTAIVLLRDDIVRAITSFVMAKSGNDLEKSTKAGRKRLFLRAMEGILENLKGAPQRHMFCLETLLYTSSSEKDLLLCCLRDF